MATDVVALNPGRPAVPKNSLEEVLNRYVQYDTKLRSGPNRQAHRPRGPFLELMGRSDQWLRNYLKNQHLTWETLRYTTDETVLFFVTFGQRPHDVTWASESTHQVLGYAFEERYESSNGRKLFAGYESDLLNGRPAIEVMYGGRKLEQHVQDEIDKVRADPTYVGHIDRMELVRCTDGWRIPVEVLELRYTNHWIDRWMTIARVIGEPHTVLRDLQGHAGATSTTSGTVSNVDLSNGVQRLTLHDPSTIIVNNLRLTPQPSLFLQVSPTPSITFRSSEDWKQLYESLLPPYRFGGKDEDTDE